MVADLRSDTITKPTPEMYAAMAAAELGDDVLGDEPTVKKLEDLAAERTGKEAALFLPSGTMANQVSLATHAKPGDSVLFEDEAHMVYYEAGAPAVISGVLCRSMPSTDGVVDPGQIERRMLTKSEHTPGTTLLCFENTHNRHGGAVTPVGHHAEYRRIADRSGMKIHLDGARVFNACVALGVDAKDITQHVDSVSFCVSKGLCSPVGSLLCGTEEFIAAARFWRKRLGGGMRQAGILAACGIVSLKQMIDRLADDHAKASTMRGALSEMPGLKPLACQTNILMVDTATSADVWQSRLEEKGVRCFAVSSNRVRFVTHRDISEVQVAHAISAVSGLAGELS